MNMKENKKRKEMLRLRGDGCVGGPLLLRARCRFRVGGALPVLR
jgi:hypothetical protein